MSTTKGRNLGLRLDEADTADLNDFEQGSGIEATTLARNALRACLAYWKQHKKISFPLRLVEVAAESQPPVPEPIKPAGEPPAAEKKSDTLTEDPAASPELASNRLRHKLEATKKRRGVTL